MKNLRRLILCVICVMLGLTACQTLEMMSIDYLQPAQVSFPEDLRRVAIVNNMPLVPAGTSFEIEDGKFLFPNVITHENKLVFGIPERAIETLAQSIADENYFDEVVICDSALRQMDDSLQFVSLTREDVNDLTYDLDVDFLISLENIQIRIEKTVQRISEGVYATYDVKVNPVIKVYVPNRNGHILHATMSDSIFWEGLGYTPTMAEKSLISEEEAIKQASDFAGTLPVKKLLPSWKTSQRFMVNGGSVDMRDGAYLAHQQQWVEATKTWERAFDKTKKTSQKAFTATNLALGYEMQDSISTAYEWAKTADSLLPEGTSYKEIVNKYKKELETRMYNLTKLKLQTER